MASLQYLLNFASTLDNLKSYWTRNSGCYSILINCCTEFFLERSQICTFFCVSQQRMSIKSAERIMLLAPARTLAAHDSSLSFAADLSEIYRRFIPTKENNIQNMTELSRYKLLSPCMGTCGRRYRGVVSNKSSGFFGEIVASQEFTIKSLFHYRIALTIQWSSGES